MLVPSEHSSPITASPGYNSTPENQDVDLKSCVMKMIESFKEDINNSLKIKKHTCKQVEDLKEKTNTSLKEIQENTIKQVKKLNKAIQDLKMKVETIKKTQMEATLEIENLGRRSGTTDASINNKLQEIEERISGIEDNFEDIDTTIKENSK
jgi:phage shock protein A